MAANTASWAVPRIVHHLTIPPNPPWVVLPADQQTSNLGFRQPRYNKALYRQPFPQDFQDFCSYEDPNAFVAAQVWFAFSRVRTLRRWADDWQRRLYQHPERDGTNLHTQFGFPPSNHLGGPVILMDHPNTTWQDEGSETLEIMYDHHADLLTQLYSDHLIEIVNPRPVRANGDAAPPLHDRALLNHLRQTIQNAWTQFRDMELDRLSTDGSQLIEGFQWLPDFENSVVDALFGMEAAWTWAQEHNIDRDRGLSLAWTTLPEMTRLLIMLISRADLFEDRMSHEHIFDLLKDKRINLLTYDAMNACGTVRTEMVYNQYYDQLHQLMNDYQYRMTHLFDYQQLVDWGYGRIWRKLFLVIDTEMSGISFATIQQFRLWAEFNGKLAHEVFSIHPIPLSDVSDNDICTICFSEIGEATVPVDANDTETVQSPQLIVELHCNHRFHTNCLFQAWDAPSRYCNRCPNCRAAEGRLQDRVNIVSQARDVDYDTPPPMQLWHETLLRRANITMGVFPRTEPRDLRGLQTYTSADIQQAFWRQWLGEWKRGAMQNRFAANQGTRYGIIE